MKTTQSKSQYWVPISWWWNQPFVFAEFKSYLFDWISYYHFMCIPLFSLFFLIEPYERLKLQLQLIIRIECYPKKTGIPNHLIIWNNVWRSSLGSHHTSHSSMLPKELPSGGSLFSRHVSGPSEADWAMKSMGKPMVWYGVVNSFMWFKKDNDHHQFD